MRLKHPPGPPMTLGNMRELGRASPHRLLPQRRVPASGADRRVELSYPDDVEVPSFRRRAKCGILRSPARKLRFEKSDHRRIELFMESDTVKIWRIPADFRNSLC